MSVPRWRSPRRRGAANLFSLLVLALVSIFGARTNASPLALQLAQQALIAGPNQGNPEPQRTPSTPIGTIPGSVRVDDRGAARISIPIAVPPAARGVQPQLSLEYDSQLGNGPLGVGWRLGGLSAITRCGRTLAVDGEVTPVRMTDDDGLCLDGERLMLLEGTAFEVGAIYRAKRDDFTRVEIIAADGDGSLHCHGGFGFEARRRDGTIAEYGCRRDATITTPLGARTWSLARVRDRFGNFVDYRYNYETAPVVGGGTEADVEHYLAAIDYGGHVELHPAARHLRLEWEARPDAQTGYFLGAPQQQSRRLRRISTFGPDGLVLRYELDYDTPSITGRSLLAAVRQCDAQGVCRPDTTFAYEPGERAVEPVPVDSNFADRNAWPYMALEGDWESPDPLALNQTMLDANGDGRTDMFLAVGDGAEPPPPGRGWELWTSQPGAVGPQGTLCGSSTPNFEGCAASGRYVVHEALRTGMLATPTSDDLGPASPPLFATDLDGDARDDVIALGDEHLFFNGAPPAGRVFYIAQSLADGGVEQFEFDPGVDTIWWFSAADQTGDGLGDLLLCGGKPLAEEVGTGTWFFIPNVPGVGFDVQNRVDTGLACSVYDKFLHLDHDGDGLASLLVIPVWDADANHWIGSSNWSNYHALRLDPLDAWAASLEDTGLPPDLAQRWRPSVAGNYNAAFAEKDFPRSMQGFGLDKILDVNGDGLDDVLRYELDIGDTAEQLGVMMQTIVALEPSWDEWGGVRVWLNTGAGFVDGGWLLQAEQPGDRLFRRFLVSGTFDYDADGRLDYLTPVDDPDSNNWNWSIWTSNGDGSFVEWPEVLAAPYDEMTHTARVMGTFDLDGDGLHDPGVLYANRWTLWEHAGAVPDKLVAVEDGLGARSSFEYQSLTDFDAPAELFEVELDACVYPERCERDPRVVVARHWFDSGITGQPREFEHRYGALRSDREGGRGLGFERHETIEWADVDGQREAVHRHAVFYEHGYDEGLRDFPFAGLPRLVIDDFRDPGTGRHRVSTDGRAYEVVQTTALTYHPYVGQRVARVYEPASCAASFCDAFFELDESSLITGTVDTIHELDEHANPLVWSSSANTGTSTLRYHHEAEYQNDVDAWQLGLPTHERVTYVQPGVPKRDREIQSFYVPGFGVLSARVVEPADVELYLHETFSYDAHGNVVARTAFDADAEMRVSSVTYDKQGVFPVSSINALGHASSMRWDPGLGVPIEARDPNDLRIVADYDGLGQLTGIRHFAGEVPRGDETTISYAGLAPVGDGSVLEIRAETDGHGYVVSEFDRLGRAVTERELSLDGVERYVTYDYDARGRIRAASLPTPEGQAPAGWERLDYDFADRPSTHTLPDGTAESWAYHGLELEHVDIGGSLSLLRYDQAARLTESIRGLGTPDEERLCFDYGAFELVERVRPNCIGREPLKISNGEAPPTIKSFAYDDLGRLVASHDPSEGPRSYFYNGHGDLEAAVDGNGNQVTLVRDALGRVVERHDIDGLTSWVWDLSFLGELAASQSPAGHEDLFEYDEFGRVTLLTKVIGGESFDLGFVYDGFDRLAEIHYPLADTLPEFWIRNVYATNGELRAVRDGPGNALIWRAEALSDEGMLTAERFGDHTLTLRDYDPLRGFVRSIETSSNLGGSLQQLEYEWNADGTLHRRKDVLHHQAEVMDYDALHRVIEVETSKAQLSHARHFAYDSLGNLVYATDRGQYDYDKDGRLAVADGHGYAWDDNGNLLTRSGAEPATLSYTAFGKLAELETDAGTTVFEYDANQDRVLRYATAEGRETIYVGDLYQRHRQAETGEVEHHYYVPGLERIVASVVDDVGPLSADRSIHYIHVDHLGSTDVVSDASGVVEQRMAYDVWGKRRDPENWTLPDEFVELGPVNLGYTGHEALEDAGLINMGGRMYDPHLGRMASADPFVVDPTSTQGWNRYAYVLNRPLSLTDPSGFEPSDPGEGDPGGGLGYEDAGRGDGKPGDQGVIGGGQEGQRKPDTRKKGTLSEPKPKEQEQKQPEAQAEQDNKADQRAGDSGPSSAGGGPSGKPGAASPWESFQISDCFGPVPHPLEGFTDAALEIHPETNESQERRRLGVSDQAGGEVIDGFQNPPAYVEISIEMTLFFIGGDLELVGAVVKGAGKAVSKRGAREALPLVAGTVKRKGKKGAANAGTRDGPRAGMPFTQQGKKLVRTRNREAHGGKLTCEHCGRDDLVDPGPAKGGVPRPDNEGQVDHIIPRADRGDGAPSNGQVLCPSCNAKKGTNW